MDESFSYLPLASNVPVVGLKMPLTNEEDQFINKLKVSSPSITEQETRGQNNNPLWFQVSRYRLSSSNFGLVSKRKLKLSQTKFVQKTILSQKDLSNAPAVKYGISNESKAAERYAQYIKANGCYVQVLALWCCYFKHHAMAGSFTRQKGDRKGIWLWNSGTLFSLLSAIYS